MRTVHVAARTTDSPSQATDASRVSRPGGKRLDVQGLRALAVVAVVVNHMTGHPRGGFVGVDVFFVISGFLITGLLLRDIDHGTSLPRYVLGFYRRRVARLLPAALLVIGVTLWAANALVSQSRADDIRHDGLWATVFLANWHFASNGTDYFANERAVSPLQHYWSLSVEEQFYVVWPIALFVFAAVAARTLRRLEAPTARRTGGLMLVAAGSIASFAYALHETSTAPTAAYFSSIGRAWELGLGALVACLVPRVRLPRSAASILSVAGVAIIGVSLFTVDGAHDFPAPAAVVPCLGAALCLVAGGARPMRNPLLTNRVSVYLGDISYSVYLVHFPIIVLLATVLPASSTGYWVSAVALTVGSSTAMYFGVERPFIRLAHGGLRTRRDRSTESRRMLPGVMAGLTVAALGAALITMTPSAATQGDERLVAVVQALDRTDRPQAPAPAGTAAAPTAGPRAVALAASIRTALRAGSWPTLTPSINDELRRQPVPSTMQFCGEITLKSDRACTIGPRHAAHTMYVVGDSTAMAYVEAYRQLDQHRSGWNMRIGAAYGCPFSSVVTENADTGVTDRCAAHNNAVVADVNRLRPDLVLITNSYTDRTSAATGRALSDEQWNAALGAEVARLHGDPRIAVVAPAPLGTDPYDCYTPTSTPADCVSQVTAQYLQRAGDEKSLAAQKGWSFVNSEGWFCDAATGYCPAFARGVPIKHDALHVSYAYDDVIYRVVAESLEREGLLHA